MGLGLGIDTGGTYTDSVIVDLDSGRVLSKAKALTTRQDLVAGVESSIGKLDRELFSQIRLVGLSTTLATNSIVERKGSRVGLILAVPNPQTFSLPQNNPADETAVVAGSHNRCGAIAVPLDVAAAEQAVRRMIGQVDAFAVSGYFSIYNAGHELRIREMISALSPLPVVCGFELSGDVGLVERATTAALNARLLPVVGELLAAVREVLAANGIQAPLMVVKGDGALVGVEVAAGMPVETILSGPAASVVGACRLSGLADAVVVDMGGTTTDIALIEGGIVATSRDGAEVGGWKTRVHSVDIRTAGLGGDSKVVVRSSDDLSIGPHKAIPLCRAASTTPGLTERLLLMEGMNASNGKDGTYGKDSELVFFTLVRRPAFSLSPSEEQLFAALDGNVLDRGEVVVAAGPFVPLDRFVELGLVAEIAFTPTDLLHARGELGLWDCTAARSAARMMAHRVGLTEEALLDLISRELTDSLKLNILAKLLSTNDPQGRFRSADTLRVLGDLLRLRGNAAVEAAWLIKKPLIAVGAPVGSYFPGIAKALGATLVIPEHAEVANAVGAVTGRVVERADAVIRPERPDGYVVVTADEQRRFADLVQAERFAEEHVSSTACRKAESSGGTRIEVTVTREELSASLDKGWGDSVFIERKVSATAVGVPSSIA
ncbi:MAG: hydantoinase/oxoprolinase family protein [Oryzomonas sp.]|jgi:N-methylhydantoinase A/oxoprolinase/acetone carboxylase beta subunit